MCLVINILFVCFVVTAFFFFSIFLGALMFLIPTALHACSWKRLKINNSAPLVNLYY